jgi:hypothetical protein
VLNGVFRTSRDWEDEDYRRGGFRLGSPITSCLDRRSGKCRSEEYRGEVGEGKYQFQDRGVQGILCRVVGMFLTYTRRLNNVLQARAHIHIGCESAYSHGRAGK